MSGIQTDLFGTSTSLAGGNSSQRAMTGIQKKNRSILASSLYQTPISRTKIKWDWDKMQWQHIAKEYVEIWELYFPNVDVIQEITVKMPIWLQANQNNKKAHKKNWVSFILKWLGRQQERSIGR